MAVTASTELAQRMRQLRDHGQLRRYHHAAIGYNYRLPSLQAAVLRVKLAHLPAWDLSRRRLVQQYNRLLADVDVTLPVEAPDARSAYHLYVVRSERRDALAQQLSTAGIGCAVHYPVPVHRQPPYAAYAPAEPLAQTDAAASQVLSLPLHAQMSPEEVEFVSEKVAAFAGKPSAPGRGEHVR
jgi:dTDP-4-amino-4,6-dideoxygalactose transaminase